MGQAFLIGPDHDTTAAALEALIPADIANLKPGQQRYSQLLNDEGGIIDDLMVTRSHSADDDGSLMLVVNASRKEVDYAHIAARLPDDVRLEPMPERALLALQGPAAKDVMAKLSEVAAGLPFMGASSGKVGEFDCHISRSGYTGEDGFEISVAGAKVEKLARLLLAQEGVQPIGLGARDSLRLEAGLCLYGHDIDETTSPIEAGLAWSIQKRRRSRADFPGPRASRTSWPMDPSGGASASGRTAGRPRGKARRSWRCWATSSGVVTSGGFGPSVNGPVAMGYVKASYAEPGKPVNLMVRGKALSAAVAPLPFVPHRYARK